MRMTVRTIVAALAIAGSAFAQDPEKLKVGSQAPEAMNEHVEFIQGDSFGAFSRDNVYVIEFWATWCGPCKQSIPHINKIHRELAPKGLVVVGVSDETPEKVRPFVKQMGATMSYPVVVQKKDDQFMKEKWMKAAEQNGIPCAFVVNRAGKVVFIGHPMDPEFERAARLSVANRYDPELFKRVDETVTEARRVAKMRDWRQAQSLYEKAIDEDPVTLLDYGFELWRMLKDQAGDQKAAEASVRGLVDKVSKDKYALIEATNYLATATDVKSRDLDAAQYAADKLKSLAGTSDPQAMSAIAAVAAARGDWATAADMQYDAWMAAPPSVKDGFKKALDTYEERRSGGK
jgi:thiol-disulfide isomerase/thioredoxin